MSLVLGIHCGHHAACALVKDGVLVAALQQERLTRIKADGREFLSNLLPVKACLRAASANLSDLDMIVSSFQAASPGGIGLHRPLVEPEFNLFEPFDPRHFVISHHFAHALCAFGSSGYSDAAALICDLGGSTTVDGNDFLLPFGEFRNAVSSLTSPQTVITECLSIYEIDERTIRLCKREFCMPHNAPDVFVGNVASLYDNVSRTIFRREDAHGQLMALASLENRSTSIAQITSDHMLNVRGDDITFRNDWQHGVDLNTNALDCIGLAKATQLALQRCLMSYAVQARTLTNSENLVGGGGTFLNIIANSELMQSGLFRNVFVPSSPHDAGVAVGCAFAGCREVRSGCAGVRGEAGDRLGPTYSVAEINNALSEAGLQPAALQQVSPREVAQLLRDGRVIARFSGRSEFGPRALGARSLLASPLLSESKTRLNAIKGRQSWRPVAPIILEERVNKFFEGPAHSPYMNFVHWVRSEFRNELLALFHPDGSTRAQTLRRIEDPFLYDVIDSFGELTGFPIVVNTSLNGPGEPIVETPNDVVEFVIKNNDVGLLFDEKLLRECPIPSWKDSRLAPDVLFTFLEIGEEPRVLLIRGAASLELSREAFDCLILSQASAPQALDKPNDSVIDWELQQAAKLRFLVPVQCSAIEKQ